MKIELISRGENKDPERPALLFIHGGFHGAWCWDEHYLPWFEERGWAAHALSLRGHGASDGADEIQRWSLADYAADVEGVIDRIGAPVVLIGHSMGGVIAQQCFSARDDVTAMALIASSPLRPSASILWRLLRRRPVSLILGQLLNDPVRMRRAMEVFFFSPELTRDQREAHRRRLSLESPAAMSELFSRPPPTTREGDDRPVLMLAGADDLSIPLADHEVTRQAYRATLEVCPGAHDLMLDPQWEASAETIERWLRDHFR